MRFCRQTSAVLVILGTPFFLAHAAESDALAISANIQAVHMPYGTILDPIYASPTSDQIVGYARCGDSALWTGAYLAAEAFRYNVTQSADALNNVRTALAGLNALSAVTGDNQLARCMVPASSPYAAGIESQEASNTIHTNGPWIWVDNTSRDEVVGAFFGLAAAYDMVDDDTIRSSISNLITLLLGYISSPLVTQRRYFEHVSAPPGGTPDVGAGGSPRQSVRWRRCAVLHTGGGDGGPGGCPEQRLLFQVQPGLHESVHLDPLQNNSDNRGAYNIVRGYTASHQNAFFDIIDRALNGANDSRDAEMRDLLDQWLQRPQRDPYVNLTSANVAVCGTEACQPVSVPWRPTTDFLWQRDPFQLAGGGAGTIEGSQIDYLLPHWMGRYYGVLQSATVQSSTAPVGAVAVSSLASIYGTNLAPGVTQAGSQPFPSTLGTVTTSITDSAGAQRAGPLIYVSPTQINFVVPDGTAPGTANFVVSNGSTTQTVTATVQSVAPGLFSMNGSGTGVAAATAIAVPARNPESQSAVPVFQCDGSGCVSVPIGLSADRTIYVSLYGTGIRNLSSLATVSVTVSGKSVPVLYAGASPGFTGLDQVNISLPPSLSGSGESNVIVTVEGQISNTVMIDIQ